MVICIYALRNIVAKKLNEFRRKLDLSRELEKIITEDKIMKASLVAEHAEELFEKHGQVKDVKPVEWRLWQKGVLEYMNNPIPRRIIWVVGGKGNEGKNFFQGQIIDQYRKHRVYTLSLTANSSDLLHHMGGRVDIPTDIFLFNIEKGVSMENIDYTLLEKIKDGEAVSTKYNIMYMTFTTPNGIIVFSNKYPDTYELSSYRWSVFKINSGIELEEVTEAQLKKKRGGGYTSKNRYNGYNQMTSNKADYDSE